MQFISTRNPQHKVSINDAIQAGLAPDGGLYIPEKLPKISLADIAPNLSYPNFAEIILTPFFAQSPLANSLNTLCNQAFNFPVPLKVLNETTWVMELFHGPTLSFKDFGARFLAECINALSTQEKTTILVATSGDTGSAVAAAFYHKPQARVIVLFPKGEVSARQEQQITCWQDNVLAIAVKGHFDDCQHLVKSAFKAPNWQDLHLSTANSINLGRLLPQVVYYAYWSLHFQYQHGIPAGFIVPSGNLGNVTAAYWAQAMGFPIREIVMATNANRPVQDYLATGKYQPRASINTLANAMDVGNPSNFERLLHLFADFPAFKQEVTAIAANDNDIAQTIEQVYKQTGIILCPHTATAYFARQQLSDYPWILAATADPSKFEAVIEPLIHQTIPVPLTLTHLLQRPNHSVEIAADLDSLHRVAVEYFEKRSPISVGEG